jgi:hypothetical protein
MLTPWAAQNTGARRDSRDTTSAKEAATNGTAVPSPRLRSAKGVDGKQRRTSEFRRQALHTRTFLAGPFSPSGGSNSLCRTTRCALPQSDDRAIAHMARAGFHLHCATGLAPDSINQKPPTASIRSRVWQKNETSAALIAAGKKFFRDLSARAIFAYDAAALAAMVTSSARHPRKRVLASADGALVGVCIGLPCTARHATRSLAEHPRAGRRRHAVYGRACIAWPPLASPFSCSTLLPPASPPNAQELR